MAGDLPKRKGIAECESARMLPARGFCRFALSASDPFKKGGPTTTGWAVKLALGTNDPFKKGVVLVARHHVHALLLKSGTYNRAAASE